MHNDDQPIYKISVADRQYTSWEIVDTTTQTARNLDLNPWEHKLFSNDVFAMDSTGKPVLLHSSVRHPGTYLPAILVLCGNKTYGREKTVKKLRLGKLLYKCVPDDRRLPSFLVPFEIKEFGFHKVLQNMFVTISFDKWEGNQHPHGKLYQVIGPVDVLDNFYEYQLYCKSLHASIQKFQKETSSVFKTTTTTNPIDRLREKYPELEDRTLRHVITIDPPLSQDFDDAFSLSEDGKTLSIYIANVPLWMDTFQLWSSFSQRVATIYLPDKKRPMLPTLLSDSLCSLQQGCERIAFVMDIDLDTSQVVTFANAIITVKRNFVYEEPDLLTDPLYVQLMQRLPDVRNSHDVVSALMIQMNLHCAKALMAHNTGIFRSSSFKRDFTVPDTVPKEVGKFIQLWSSASAHYSVLTTERHELMDADVYVHITSPIRRLVDLLNMLQLQRVTNMVNLSEDAITFYDKWVGELEYINVTMRAIRKVQVDCSLLQLCSQMPLTDKVFDGYVFDKLIRNDGLCQCVVFLPDLKMTSRITVRENLHNFEKHRFKLHLFQDEETLKRKIRLELCC